MTDDSHTEIDPWLRMRAFTRARIGLARAGDAVTTAAQLAFQLAHANARDAVHGAVDFASLAEALGADGAVVRVRSRAADRVTYLRRPDLGRRLDAESLARLQAMRGAYDVVFVVGDGLSSAAIMDHAVAALRAVRGLLTSSWRVAPIVLAEQARVALADEVAEALGAGLAVMLIGERPGLSVHNGLSFYMTWQPRVGRQDSERNCISNIHADGLAYDLAAAKLVWLMGEARRLKFSGFELKENVAGALIEASAGQIGESDGGR